MIGSSPELGPIMAGTHLLKRREVKYRFCTDHLSHFAGFFVFFPRVSVRILGGKEVILVKNLNMNGEFIDVVENTV